MFPLNWINGKVSKKSALLELNLSHKQFDGMEGVYVIWHGSAQPRVVRIGQGVIKDRLGDHRQDKKILRFAVHGLFVTSG